MKKFTEEDTERYYDSEDKIYLSFWDEKGTCHCHVGSSDRRERRSLKFSEQ